MTFDITSLMYMGGVGLIVALVELIKKWVKDSRWYPLSSMVLGILINVAIGSYVHVALLPSVFMGLLAGLAACGLYSIASGSQP